MPRQPERPASCRAQPRVRLFALLFAASFCAAPAVFVSALGSVEGNYDFHVPGFDEVGLLGRFNLAAASVGDGQTMQVLVHGGWRQMASSTSDKLVLIDLALNSSRILDQGTTKPSARFGHRAEWVNGRFTTCQGANEIETLGDCWKYDLTSNTWTQLIGVSGVLPVVYRAGTSVDKTSRFFITFGGWFSTSGRNELWRIDVTGVGAAEEVLPAVPGTQPSPRMETVLIRKGDTDTFLLLGGYGDLGGGKYSSFYEVYQLELSGLVGKWTLLTAAPGWDWPRAGIALFDRLRNVTLFGFGIGSAFTHNMYVSDGTGENWTLLDTIGTVPSARAYVGYASVALANGDAALFGIGGDGVSGLHHSDAFLLQLVTASTMGPTGTTNSTSVVTVGTTRPTRATNKLSDAESSFYIGFEVIFLGVIFLVVCCIVIAACMVYRKRSSGSLDDSNGLKSYTNQGYMEPEVSQHISVGGAASSRASLTICPTTDVASSAEDHAPLPTSIPSTPSPTVNLELKSADMQNTGIALTAPSSVVLAYANAPPIQESSHSSFAENITSPWHSSFGATQGTNWPGQISGSATPPLESSATLQQGNATLTFHHERHREESVSTPMYVGRPLTPQENPPAPEMASAVASSRTHVCLWLEDFAGLGSAQAQVVANTLAGEDVDTVDLLCALAESELEQLGIKLGPRKRILTAAARHRQTTDMSGGADSTAATNSLALPLSSQHSAASHPSSSDLFSDIPSGEASKGHMYCVRHSYGAGFDAVFEAAQPPRKELKKGLGYKLFKALWHRNRTDADTYLQQESIEFWRGCLNIIYEKNDGYNLQKLASTVLRLAIRNDWPDMVARLLQMGADPNLNRHNALCYAATFPDGRGECVKALLAGGARVNAPWKEGPGLTHVQLSVSAWRSRVLGGATAAHVAAAWGHYDMLSMLIVAGADLSLHNTAGMTPRECAVGPGTPPANADTASTRATTFETIDKTLKEIPLCEHDGGWLRRQVNLQGDELDLTLKVLSAQGIRTLGLLADVRALLGSALPLAIAARLIRELDIVFPSAANAGASEQAASPKARASQQQSAGSAVAQAVAKEGGKQAVKFIGGMLF